MIFFVGFSLLLNCGPIFLFHKISSKTLLYECVVTFSISISCDLFVCVLGWDDPPTNDLLHNEGG